MMSPVRILHLEDDESDALLVRSVLEAEGLECEVVHAKTREEFVASLEDGDYDLILSDYALKSFDGISALALTQRANVDAPFIFVSGTMGEELAIESFKSGATDYVLKERMNRLVPAARRALAEAGERRKRKAAETALLRQAKLLSLAADGILIRDLEGRIAYWNLGAERLYGWSQKEAYGRITDELLATCYPDGGAEDARSRLLAHGRWEGELVQSARDGRRVTVESRWTLERTAEGQAASILVINTDLTARKQLEEQLRHSQKMEAVGSLAGGIAHDFNNMLTSVLGFSHLLLTELDPDSPLREFVQEILKAGDRAAALTRQLLAFSRRQVLNPVVADLNSVVQDLGKTFGRLIGEDIELVTVLSPDLVRVRIDAGQMEQAIVNLIVNARDAMPRGGRLTIETRNVEVGVDRVRSEVPPELREGRCALLSVSDTGTGMDAATQARIFEPFFTTKPRGRGTGLGLSTVYGLVQQSGGHIAVSSEPGRGTTFRIYLASTEVAQEPAPSTDRDQSSERGLETILLVEDEEGVRRIARRALQGKGYRILEAASGAEAIELARAHRGRIDLLLTDVVMQGASGPDVARALLRQRPDLKVLYMSGYTDDEMFTRGLLDKGVAFLQKPFGFEGIAHKVRETLDGVEREGRPGWKAVSA